MRTLTKILFTFFVLRFALSFLTWHPDVNNHIDWGIRFWQYGPEQFYKANVWSFTWPNQPPGSIWLFAAVRKIFEAVFAFFWFINVNIPLFPSGIITFFESNLYPALLKLPAVLADIGIAWLIYKIFAAEAKEKIGIFGAAVFLLNPASWYNSTIWGQTDSVVNFFGLLAFVLLLKKKLLWAVAALLGSFYIKASLLLFLPIFIVVVLRQRYKSGHLLAGLGIPLLAVGILTLPFSQSEPYTWLFNLYKDKVFTQQLQVITANAFNIWAALTGIHERPHELFLGPLTYKVWGWLLFGLSALPALWLVFKKQDKTSIFWSLTIVSFSAFMLLTNMHERYLYPLFPVFTILAADNRKLLPLYVAASGIHLVNLYNFWWFPKVEVLVSLLAAWDRLLPRILGLVTFLLFVFLYRHFWPRVPKFSR